jgi:hypothetical protein
MGGWPRLNSENVFGWPTPFVGFYTSAPSRCIRGMNGEAVLLSFFLISLFLFSKFREFQAGACRAASVAAD